MKKMAGIVLMIVGVLIFGLGLYFYIQTNKETSTVTENATEASIPSENANVDSAFTANDAEEINKKQGDDFEKFIVQKFDKKYFTLKEWAGHKFVKGVYAETTTQRDLLFKFRLKKEE